MHITIHKWSIDKKNENVRHTNKQTKWPASRSQYTASSLWSSGFSYSFFSLASRKCWAKRKTLLLFTATKLNMFMYIQRGNITTRRNNIFVSRDRYLYIFGQNKNKKHANEWREGREWKWIATSKLMLRSLIFARVGRYFLAK